MNYGPEAMPPSPVEDAQLYFGVEQPWLNHQGEDLPVRIERLTYRLNGLEDGTWNGGEGGQRRHSVDIYVAPVGSVLQPRLRAEHPTQTVYYSESDAQATEEMGGRSFLWGVTVHPGIGKALTIFLDAETGCLGVYDYSPREAAFHFPKEQGRIVELLEKEMGLVFHPNKEIRHWYHPSEKERLYSVKPL